jgi:UDP-glucose 4-epimerase
VSPAGLFSDASMSWRGSADHDGSASHHSRNWERRRTTFSRQGWKVEDGSGSCDSGAGFIGSHLVDALLAHGDAVRVLDDFSTGNPANLVTVRERADIMDGDVTDQEVVRGAMRGVEVGFHQAALASVPRSVVDPMSTHRTCVDGTLNVLLAARDAGVRRVVYAGSSSAYGDSGRLPRMETDLPAPLSPYAVAKLAGEMYCAAFSKVYGLETVRLRYFNVFGPRQTPNSPYAAVIPLFLQALSTGRSPRVHGDGHQSRDFTYVSDVVQANLRAAATAGVSGRVYNVACGRRTSLLEVLGHLNVLLGTSIEPTFGPPRVGDVRDSQADIIRAVEDLGYVPTTDVRTGLSHCVRWWRQRMLDSASQEFVEGG